MNKSVPRVTVWRQSAEPRDAKTVFLGTDLSYLPHTDDRFTHLHLLHFQGIYGFT